MTVRALLKFSAAAFCLFAAMPGATAEMATAPVAGARSAIGDFGFDVAGMDRSVTPGNDWRGFANGGYLSKLEIPADRSNYGMFTRLTDLSQDRSRAIIEKAAASSARKGSNLQKIGDYYAAYLDEAAVEAKGLAPIRADLDAIAGIGNRTDLARAIAVASRAGTDVPVRIGVRPDAKDPGVMAVQVSQGGLGLPDRDYYLDTASPKFAEARAKYQAHVATMLGLAGLSDAAARAQRVFALETAIAKAHWSRVESRQAEKTYNPVPSADLDTRFAGIAWASVLGASGVGAQSRVIVRQPGAIAGIAALVASEPIDSWKDYLTYQTLARWAPMLPKAFVDADFAFNGTVLGGQPQLQPRWKRAVDATSAVLGEAVGKLYVAEYFPPEAKAKADALVKNILAAMDARLARLEWMDPRTRAAARAKLAAFTPKIGYPSKWRDYSNLEIMPGDLIGNARRATAFEYQRQLDKFGKPVDRTEWGMTPMTVNAYANFGWNEIVFPAAILQAPFFDPAADPAVNYGGIGAVIGHEISHHFDDQGRKFDKQGKLADWWTPEDVKRFTVLTDKVVKQYGEYEPLKGTHVNGALTLGENMADLAGVTIAYDAYHRSLNGRMPAVIDGFSGDQRFFLGFAQVWRQKYRDAALLRQLTTDPHTTGSFRPNVVRNIDGWYAAFGAAPGEALYLSPADRVRVW
jgi:putative endopeptidase